MQLQRFRRRRGGAGGEAEIACWLCALPLKKVTSTTDKAKGYSLHCKAWGKPCFHVEKGATNWEAALSSLQVEVVRMTAEEALVGCKLEGLSSS